MNLEAALKSLGLPVEVKTVGTACEIRLLDGHGGQPPLWRIRADRGLLRLEKPGSASREDNARTNRSASFHATPELAEAALVADVARVYRRRGGTLTVMEEG